MKAVKILGLALIVLVALFMMVSPVMAQAKDAAGTAVVTAPSFFSNAFGKGIGAGLVLMGAAMGFGKIGSSALESMARQPETAGKVQTAMIIIGALLEGATFFALIVCITIAA